MIAWFFGLPPVWQALLASIFTWGVTAAGAAVVFLLRRPSKAFLDGMLGFAAGVMLAASYWSLLAPAIDMAESLRMSGWGVAVIGFMLGGAVLCAGERLHSTAMRPSGEEKAGRRSALLIGAITLHNIPEGMAVGVAFGSLACGIEGATLSAACMLALGIGLQNFPEGAAVSVPLLREGASKGRAFFIGQLSGIVEPVASVIGALLVLRVRVLLPFMLSFAAGAMIYVVTEELIPESQRNKRGDLMALFTMAGFSVMMLLDVALG